jgi:hypothetical protein
MQIVYSELYSHTQLRGEFRTGAKADPVHAAQCRLVAPSGHEFFAKRRLLLGGSCC